MSIPVAVDPALRRAVLAAGVLAQAAAVLAGVLPLPILPLVAALLWVAARLASTAGPERSKVLLQISTALALVAVLISLPRVAAGGSQNLRGTLGPLLVYVQLAQALTWSARRDLQTGLLVAIGLLLLGASYAPDLVVGLPLLLGWTACVVATVLLVRQRERESADAVAVPDGRPAPAPLALVAGLALALGVAAFLVVPVPHSAGLQSKLASAASSAQAPSDGSRAAGLTSSESLDTSDRGSLSDRPLAEVDSGSPRLWRNRAYDTWDGRTWSSSAVQVRQLRGLSPYVLSDEPVGRTDAVRLLSDDGTLWAPGRVVSVSLPGGLSADVTTGDTLSGRRSAFRYTVQTAAQDLSHLTSDPVGDSSPRWLALPPSTTDRTRALAAQVTAGSTTQAGAVRAVEAWLGAHLRYQLDSPVPAVGEDAVDRFLFVDKVGFCEIFATAEVVLLRAAGYPARMVVGLAYGADAGGGKRTFREKDLHAWVESPYAHAGWVASDPTAGAALAEAAKQSARDQIASALRSFVDWLQDLPGGRWTLVGALLALCLVGGLLWRRFTRRPEPEPCDDVPEVLVTGPESTALAAFLRLDGRLAQHGRTRSESLREMRSRLGLDGERAAAFEVVEAECYAPVRPDPGPAVEVLDRWAGP